MMTGSDLACALAAAVALDRLWGELPAPVHPVVWMGRIARSCARARPTSTPIGELVAGALLVVAVPCAFALASHRLLALVESWRWASVAVAAVLLSATFAIRGLGDAALLVARALEDRDVPAGRRALRSLCSRDPAGLGETELASSAVQSVAENANDSVVAPLFYFALFGVPGAMAYRAVNTLDAVVGYRGELERFGKASARLDDLLGWVPARITAALVVVAGAALGGRGRAGLRAWRRHGDRTPSPNGGRPMAAMAGVLGVVLAKPGGYVLGDPAPAPTAATVRQSCRVLEVVAALASIVALVVVWSLRRG